MSTWINAPFLIIYQDVTERKYHVIKCAFQKCASCFWSIIEGISSWIEKSCILLHSPWRFKKALFYHKGFWNIGDSFGRLIIHLDEPFWNIRRPETNYIKTRLLFSKKNLKVWHFLLKKRYFRIQKARFWKGMFGDTISQQNQFLRTFSSLEIFFEAPRIKCAFFSCPLMPHYELWKIAEKLQFC